MIIDTKRVIWTQSEMTAENRMVEDASVDSEIETTKSEKVATIGHQSTAFDRGSGIHRRRPRAQAPDLFAVQVESDAGPEPSADERRIDAQCPCDHQRQSARYPPGTQLHRADRIYFS